MNFFSRGKAASLALSGLLCAVLLLFCPLLFSELLLICLDFAGFPHFSALGLAPWRLMSVPLCFAFCAPPALLVAFDRRLAAQEKIRRALSAELMGFLAAVTLFCAGLFFLKTWEGNLLRPVMLLIRLTPLLSLAFLTLGYRLALWVSPQPEPDADLDLPAFPAPASAAAAAMPPGDMLPAGKMTADPVACPAAEPLSGQKSDTEAGSQKNPSRRAALRPFFLSAGLSAILGFFAVFAGTFGLTPPDFIGAVFYTPVLFARTMLPILIFRHPWRVLRPAFIAAAPVQFLVAGENAPWAIFGAFMLIVHAVACLSLYRSSREQFFL